MSGSARHAFCVIRSLLLTRVPRKLSLVPALPTHFTSPTEWERSPRNARRERDHVLLVSPSPALRACLSHFVGEAGYVHPRALRAAHEPYPGARPDPADVSSALPRYQAAALAPCAPVPTRAIIAAALRYRICS